MTLYPITRFVGPERESGLSGSHPQGSSTRMPATGLLAADNVHGFRTDQAQDLSHHSRREPCLDRRKRGLVSDATMIARGGPPAAVGMNSIKQRRVTLPVTCHAGTTVGQYVPFYFLPAVRHALRPASGQPPEPRISRCQLLWSTLRRISSAWLPGRIAKSALGVQSSKRGRGLYGLPMPT